MDVQTAVVLAGGQGRRLRPLVADRPKPLANIAGRPFLTHLLDFWIEQGICRFILAVGYRWQMIAEQLGNDYRGARIDYAVESTPLGTGGALLQALQRLDRSEDPVWVINGDTLFAVDACAMRAAHRKHCADLTLACRCQLNNARFGALALDSTGCIVQFNANGAAGKGWINGGVYLLERHLASEPLHPSSLEQELIPGWLAAGRMVFAFRTDAFFIDIGIPEDYRRARELLPQRPWTIQATQTYPGPIGGIFSP
ncbi:MAG: nucleotidyltransferase family protein [Candidatus Competibacteraceae bacterium]|nr:nucleotidyltransferase family protein [Candidatus Competibacteraceae bacterium]HRY16247.1 nucleotidyltransferase family protein [Candidatus Competibacteraceae bacterium]